MKINELVEHVNRLTDEDYPASMIVPFLNDGMAKINEECDANFPFLKVEENDTEPAIPEKWQRLLLCIFASGRVKENDSSQFEYMDFYSQFDASLLSFKSKYKIPEQYKDTSVSKFSTDDFDSSPWRW